MEEPEVWVILPPLEVVRVTEEPPWRLPTERLEAEVTEKVEEAEPEMEPLKADWVAVTKPPELFRLIPLLPVREPEPFTVTD